MVYVLMMSHRTCSLTHSLTLGWVWSRPSSFWFVHWVHWGWQTCHRPPVSLQWWSWLWGFLGREACLGCLVIPGEHHQPLCVCVRERERELNRMSYLIMHVVCRSSVTAMSSVYLSQATSFSGYAQPCNSLLDLQCIISTIMAASGSRFEVWLLICCRSRDSGGFHSRGTRRSLYVTNWSMIVSLRAYQEDDTSMWTPACRRDVITSIVQTQTKRQSDLMRVVSVMIFYRAARVRPALLCTCTILITSSFCYIIRVLVIVCKHSLI